MNVDWMPGEHNPQTWEFGQDKNLAIVKYYGGIPALRNVLVEYISSYHNELCIVKQTSLIMQDEVHYHYIQLCYSRHYTPEATRKIIEIYGLITHDIFINGKVLNAGLIPPNIISRILNHH